MFKLTIKTPERRQWRRSGVFIVNFEHIAHLVLVFLLLNFEHVNAGWITIERPFTQLDTVISLFP